MKALMQERQTLIFVSVLKNGMPYSNCSIPPLGDFLHNVQSSRGDFLLMVFNLLQDNVSVVTVHIVNERDVVDVHATLRTGQRLIP